VSFHELNAPRNGALVLRLRPAEPPAPYARIAVSQD